MLKVVFFARLREIMAVEQLMVELSVTEVSTVKDILTDLAAGNSCFNDYLIQGNRLMIAVNQQICDQDKILKIGDELALFPPVTGG